MGVVHLLYSRTRPAIATIDPLPNPATHASHERMSDPICPLCDRPIPPGCKQSLHHLIPKLKGGKGGPTVLLHHICHKEIHASLTEAELARSYNTPETLKAHPRLSKFIAWVRKRPPEFLSKTTGGRRKR